MGSGSEKNDFIVDKVRDCISGVIGWFVNWKNPCCRQAERISLATVGEVNEMIGKLRDGGVGTMVRYDVWDGEDDGNGGRGGRSLAGGLISYRRLWLDKVVVG